MYALLIILAFLCVFALAGVGSAYAEKLEARKLRQKLDSIYSKEIEQFGFRWEGDLLFGNQNGYPIKMTYVNRGGYEWGRRAYIAVTGDCKHLPYGFNYESAPSIRGKCKTVLKKDSRISFYENGVEILIPWCRHTTFADLAGAARLIPDILRENGLKPPEQLLQHESIARLQ